MSVLSPERAAQDAPGIGEHPQGVCLDTDDSVVDLSALRLVPVPEVGLPFDGELQAGPTVTVDQSCARELGAVAGPVHPVMSTAGMGQLEGPDEWPRQFARLLAEALAGARPARQILPWTSERARGHLHRLMPLFGGGQRPRVVRVIATRPTRQVIEMTVVLNVGPRTRALAIRLEHMAPPRRLSRHTEPVAIGAGPDQPATAAPRWVCTDIEAA